MLNHHEALEHFINHMQTINRHLRSSTFDQGDRSMTRVQWLLMRQLQRRGQATIGQLAEHLDVRSSTMSQMLDRMEKSELVVRESDPDDARVRTVRLTPKGNELMSRFETQWLEALSEPFGSLSAAERSQLVALMEKLAAQLTK